MGRYHVYGGNKLSGELKICGSKNAILPILASVVLNGGASVIHNCPQISDTFISIEILKSLGCKVKLEGSSLIADSTNASSCEVPEHLVREMRSSLVFLGGVLGRFGHVKISYPGGCELGQRPIDLHIKGLKQLGVKIKEKHGFLICSVDKLRGAKINLDFPSVGATENLMLAAVKAEGETIIFNAAKEPEIVDMQNFLNGMGAKIHGAGTDTITIEGVSALHDVEHKVIPDRIVAGTMLTAATMTKGEIILEQVIPEHLYPITSKLAETGCLINIEKDKIRLKAPETIKPVGKLRTHPHPGFPNCNKNI